MVDEAAVYLAKAEESLAGAESGFTAGRYNNCANRCYYACFPAAVSALVRAGIRPAGDRGAWDHAFVQARFSGQLVNRRKLYPGTLGNALVDTFDVRRDDDYRSEHVRERQAALPAARPRGRVGRYGERRVPFMTATGFTVQERLDERISTALAEAENDPRTQAAIDELRGLIRTAYPTADFSIEHGVEPPALYLIATIDEDDIDDARDLFIDRLVDMEVDEGLPLHVHLKQPRERALAAHRDREAGTVVREPVAHG